MKGHESKTKIKKLGEKKRKKIGGRQCVNKNKKNLFTCIKGEIYVRTANDCGDVAIALRTLISY